MKAAIYVRVSSDDQSTNLQRDDLFKYCAAHGLEYELFEEKASGKNRERPELIRMLSAIKEGRFSRLLIWRLDRISRSMRDFTNLIYELEASGCALVSIKEAIDMNSPTGRLMVNILGSFSQFEREIILQRTNAGLAAAKSRGVKLGPPEKELDCSRLKSLMAQGLSFDDIALELGFSKSHLYRKIRGCYGSIKLLRAG